MINTAPVKSVNDIDSILKSMSVPALKKQFGLNTLEFKFVGIKDFMDKNNIQSGSKYPPRLTLAHKHIINMIIVKASPKKQQVAYIKDIKKILNHKIKNPPKLLYGKAPSPKQIEHINSALKAELDRW